MNFRLTMVLVIVLLLMITAYFAVLTHSSGVEPKKDTAPKNALVSPQPKDVRTISYLRDGQVVATKTLADGYARC